MDYMYVFVVLILALSVQGRETTSLLADLGPDSPWIINSASSHHVRGESNAAKFKGVPFTLSRDAVGNETEYRVFRDNVIAMETVIKRLGETALYFREVTDGHKVIKLVYAGRKGLVECDVQQNLLNVDEFVARFLDSKASYVSHLRHVREPLDVNVIMTKSDVLGKPPNSHSSGNDAIGEPYITISDMDTLHVECKQLHRRMKRKLRAAGIHVKNYEHLVTPEDNIDASRAFIPRRVKRTKRGTSKSRTKRSLLIPDTKWCGAGSDNDGFDDVGHSRSTDRCCREHDHCPYYIGAFSKDYGLFNSRFYTISHCYCDETFRTCLKTASTDQSHMVGRVYFNVLGLKCFEFETADVCVKRSWWGGCQQYEPQVVAKIRGSLSWS